jgi:hypothetical protein
MLDDKARFCLLPSSIEHPASSIAPNASEFCVRRWIPARESFRSSMFDVFELLPQIGLSDAVFFSHTYTVPIDLKVERMKRVIRDWDLGTDKRKKTKKEIKVHDLKPSKDAKGGGGAGHNISLGGNVIAGGH